jgi:hypothetical protein
MEPLKQPKDVLALGEHLVRELGFKDGVDTLGRWMSHHLAELIDKAKNGKTAAKRTEAGRQATETILQIWEHRRSLPGRSYPLAPLNEVLTVLHRLRPEANPFGIYRQYGDTKTDHCAAILFDGLMRLVIVLLLMRIPGDEYSNNTSNSATEALSDEEQQVLRAILGWYEFFTPKATNSTGRQKRKKKGAGDSVDLRKVAIQIINQIEPTLAELRDELQQTG